MFMPLGISWHVNRAPILPILELSAKVYKSNNLHIQNIDFIYLQLAVQMISIIEKHNGMIVTPFNNLPEGVNIFFTAQFDSNEYLESFLKHMGWERTDY